MTTKQETVASFVQSAPPGELVNVVADIEALASNQPGLTKSLEPAFQKYNEEQYASFTVPGTNDTVLISEYNSLGNGRYYDSAGETSFEFDHSSQKAYKSQEHPLTSQQAGLIRSLQKAFSKASAEHFPTVTSGIFPAENDSAIAILLVANKYSPQNFWNGRWRSTYILRPQSLSGTIKVDVHYYEDGNVRMSTHKKVELSNVSDNADTIVREIARAENKYQEELNRAFTAMAEGSFKGLRRQLPVTRQKVEWEKIGGYRLGQDIGGGRSK